MIDPIDLGLEKLRDAPGSGNLSGLEAGVWRRVDRETRGDFFKGRAWQVQLVVTCAALLLGLAVAQFVDGSGRQVRSEIAVLSDDGALVPSVRLEGGV